MNLSTLSAHEIIALIKRKNISARQVYQSVLDQIEKNEEKINAYVRLNQQSIDFDQLADKPYPIPIAVKDNMCMLGQLTTCASRILEGFQSPYDATVIKKLKESGAIIIGNANMDEFAFGSSSESSYYGPVRNPWNLDYVPGGSSGGSTAAVAAHEAIWAIGSDTGGSIRQPASFCGVVGLKPTYGRVSRYGLIAFASSLDQIGPITKDVTDAALLLNIIAGYDPMDSTCVDKPVPDYTQALVNDVKGLTIGLPKEYFIDGIDPQVKKAINQAVDLLQELGAQIKEVSLPHTKYAVATYYIVATAEASSNLARFDGIQYGLRSQPSHLRKTPLIDLYEETRDLGFGHEVKRRIMLGTYALSSGYYDAYYLKGLKVRTLIKKDFDAVFKHCDALITPTSPSPAFKIGEKTKNPLDMYLSDIFTISANLSGIPGISIPCGFSEKGLPIGLQILGKAFDEEMILRIAYSFEQNTDFHKKKVFL